MGQIISGTHAQRIPGFSAGLKTEATGPVIFRRKAFSLGRGFQWNSFWGTPGNGSKALLYITHIDVGKERGQEERKNGGREGRRVGGERERGSERNKREG